MYKEEIIQCMIRFFSESIKPFLTKISHYLLLMLHYNPTTWKKLVMNV